MFERMVLSGAGRRDRRLSKFFVGSSLAYLLLAGSALAVSICVSDPKLTGSGANINPRRFVAVSGGSKREDGAKTASSSRSNPNVVRRLDEMLQMPDPCRHSLPAMNIHVDDATGAGGGGGDSRGNGIGQFPGGGSGPSDGIGEAPRPVDTVSRPIAAKQIEQPQKHQTLKVSPGVLQGKAIDKKTPSYPPIARSIHREGSVLVEVMISPDGRVESARAVSGDSLLAKSAVDAAYGWRFQPTYLGDIPVRVTGIITFVFRLGE